MMELGQRGERISEGRSRNINRKIPPSLYLRRVSEMKASENIEQYTVSIRIQLYT